MSVDVYASLSNHASESWYCPSCIFADLPNPKYPNNVIGKVSGVDFSCDDVSFTSFILPSKPNASIFVTHLNIRSILTKLDDVEIFLKGIGCEHNIMVFGFSESWLDSFIPDNSL